MNTGIIAQRYAEALLKLVLENGSGERVLAQEKILSKSLRSVPQMRRTLEDYAVLDSQKMSVFASALSPEPLEPDLEKFLRLVLKKERVDYLIYIFSSFENQWYSYNRILRGVLFVPQMDSEAEELARQAKDIILSHTGKKLELEVVVKPDLIGGFIIEVEDHLLDGSVRRQLDIIRRQFVVRNRRIV